MHQYPIPKVLQLFQGQTMRTGGLVLAHNIKPRMADPNFMKAITTNPKLETVVRGGMSITLKKQ